MTPRRWSTALVGLLFLTACDHDAGTLDATAPASAGAVDAAGGVETAGADLQSEPSVMPDFVGLTSDEASRRIGALEAKANLGLWSSWTTQPVTGCEVRPRTVVAQAPGPGTPLRPRSVVQLRVAVLDLEKFRGPCDPVHGELGPVRGPDAHLAREFYRFAADQSLDAPFAKGPVWNGIESGPQATMVDGDARRDPSAWQLSGGYAEAAGPFSSLDVLASSGGYYELHAGIVPTCPAGSDQPPREMKGLRAISLTAPRDTVTDCSQWWGVTLFLEGDLIRGVALRLGSP